MQKKRPVNLAKRSLKIQPKHRCSRWSSSIVPELKLSGNWLEKLGFKVDAKVIVETTDKMIIIRPEK